MKKNRYAIFRYAGGTVTMPPLGNIESNPKIKILLKAASYVLVEMDPATKEEFCEKETDLKVVEEASFQYRTSAT